TKKQWVTVPNRVRRIGACPLHFRAKTTEGHFRASRCVTVVGYRLVCLTRPRLRTVQLRSALPERRSRGRISLRCRRHMEGPGGDFVRLELLLTLRDQRQAGEPDCAPAARKLGESHVS